ncbi:MAG: Coq4 family protein [Sphingopyxis sp.]
MTPAVFRDPARPTPRFRPFKAMGHFRKLIANKEDTEQVFRIYECLPSKHFVPTAKAFIESDVGQRLMVSEPHLPPLLDDHAMLMKLPAGSVAHAYVDFMVREGLSAAGLVAESAKMRTGRPIYDDQLQWYADRRRDTHDLFHVLTGYGRDPLGEQCVLGFSYGQSPDLGSLFIAYAGGLELKRRVKADAPIFAAIREGQRCGKAARQIVEQDVHALLAEPLEDARARLGITPPSVYEQAHAAYRGRGIDPYDFLATPLAA